MGKFLFDQYSSLHFASGIIAYFWGIKFYNWILFHLLFEIIENTELGISIINKYITFWPGGKPCADSISNIIGDNISAYLGWIFAYYLDIYGNKKGLYIKN